MYNLLKTEYLHFKEDDIYFGVESFVKQFKTIDEVKSYLKENRDFYNYGTYRVEKVEG